MMSVTGRRATREDIWRQSRGPANSSARVLQLIKCLDQFLPALADLQQVYSCNSIPAPGLPVGLPVSWTAIAQGHLRDSHLPGPVMATGPGLNSHGLGNP